ncbi:MAG TPA: hypothetical protein VGR43_05480 [Dehalococcoidia bacterium]|nr:hypothetical protein [Dehalococcoidia bacterium]
MDGFNRALAVTVAVLMVAVGASVAAVTAGALAPATVAPAGLFRDGLQDVSGLTGADRLAVAAGGAAFAAAGLVLVAAEIIPLLRQRYIAAGNGTRREFAVREEAVERMVRYAAAQVEGVQSIEQAKVRRGERGLEIACSAVLEPDAEAGPLAPFLEGRLFNAVYTMTGLPVVEVSLRMRHAEPAPQEA